LIRDWLVKRPRFHLHFTPTSASWLNLVERWFALLTEQQLQRGVHRSTKELESAIKHFIQHHNKNPKPYVCRAGLSVCGASHLHLAAV